jgi:hypothetical protein
MINITSMAARLLFIKNKQAGSIARTNAQNNRLYRLGSKLSLLVFLT